MNCEAQKIYANISGDVGLWRLILCRMVRYVHLRTTGHQCLGDRRDPISRGKYGSRTFGPGKTVSRKGQKAMQKCRIVNY